MGPELAQTKDAAASLAATQAALEASEERYRELFENANDVIYTHDLKGRFTSANAACSRIFGYEVAEFLTKNIKDIVHPDHLKRAQANMAAKVDGGLERTPPYEVLTLGKNGPVWVEVSTRMLLRHGKPFAIQGIARDIRKRKAAETRHRALFEGVPVGLFRTAPDGTILDANPALLTIMRAPDLESYLGRNISDFYVDGNMRTELLAAIDRDGSKSFTTRMRRMDGTLAWLRSTSRAVRDDDGNLVCYEGHCEDITEQETAEAGMRLVNRLALELNECPDSSTAMSLTLRRVCEVTGWSYAEAWVPNEDALVCHDAWYTSAPERVRKFRHLSKRMAFARGESIMGMLWEKPATLWHPDLDDEPWFTRAAAAKAAGFTSLVAVPVRADGHMVALLLFLHDHAQPEDARWVAVAESIANQLGTVLGRRLAEDRLRLQGALLEAHLEASEDGVLAVGSDGTILACNGNLLRICGVGFSGTEHPARLRGQALLDHIDEPKRFLRNVRTLYEESLQTKETVMLEGRKFHRSVVPVSDVDELPLGRVYHFRQL